MNAWLVRHILWPIHERLRGRGTTRLLRELRGTERLPREEVERRQVAAVRRVLEHAARTTPYYRRQFEQHGIEPASIASLADFQRVPFLSKSAIREHRDEMVDPAGRRRLSPHATSGSTGEPLQFFIDRRRTGADNAARARARLWWGVRPGDREAVIWGSPADVQRHGPLRRCHERLFNMRMLPAAELGDEDLSRLVQGLARFRPTVMFGYAAALGRLAEYVKRSEALNTPEVSMLCSTLRLVVATAEPLLPHHRRSIAEAFGCGVATEYGARECGILAGECSEGSLHVHAENALIEVVDPSDGGPLPPGETGELAVTLLREYGMPVIRYRIGDLGALAPGPCGCGMTLPVLAGVEGRRRDLLHLAGGRIVHPSVFSRAMAEVKGLTRYRVVQTARDRIRIDVCADDAAGADLSEALAAIRQELGAGIEVRVERAASLPADPGGKFRWVVGLGDEEAQR